MIADKGKECKTLRFIAMTWWDDLDDSIYDSKNPNYCKGYFAQKYYSRHWTTLSGREIETIYKQEHIIKDEKNIIK